MTATPFPTNTQTLSDDEGVSRVEHTLWAEADCPRHLLVRSGDCTVEEEEGGWRLGGATRVGRWLEPLPASQELGSLIPDCFPLQPVNRAFVSSICGGRAAHCALVSRTALS